MYDFILYGANGYTGKLITALATDYGLQPLLAGRSADKLAPLARQYGYDYRAVGLDDTDALLALLATAPVVLHAAGPFVHTARPMMEACLAAGVHYLDITGEIPVFERAHGYDAAARAAGIMLMSGVGFDVVPTDCLARYLYERLPDATHLRLAFTALGGGTSHGTAKTMVENLGRPGAVRRDGQIVPVPLGHKTRRIPYRKDKERFSMTIPWGDVSTAYYTTGIPNIETYTAIPPGNYKWVRLQRYLGPLLRSEWVRNLARRRIERQPAGPDEQQRQTGRSLVWGEVENAAGERHVARYEGPEGYRLTAISSLLVVKRVRDGQAPVGHQTPAGAYGADFALEIPGSHRADVKAEN